MNPISMNKDAVISAPKLWTVLAKCYGSIAAFVERGVAAEELCLSDFMVLEALLHEGPLTISAIGRKILLADASMTSAIDRLDRRGLVVRKASREDRRVRLVQLTPRGKALVAAIYVRHERELQPLMAGFSQNERSLLYRGLKRLGAATEEAPTPVLPETGKRQ